jgi:putative hemolysin
MQEQSLSTGLLMMTLLLVANGFFVAVEFALIAVRRSRVQEMVANGHPIAKVVDGLQKNLDFSIAGAQLGITLASLALGWVAEESVHKMVQAMFDSIPATAAWEAPAGLGIGLSFVILSMLHVIIGEQVPKSWALRGPEQMIMILAFPFRIFCILAYPLIVIMNYLAGAVLRLLRIPQASEASHAIGSPDEFNILFEQSKQAGALAEQEHELLSRSLELKKHNVGYLMVHRADIQWLDANGEYGELVKAVARATHSRMLLCEGDLDRVIGFIDVRAILSMVLQGTKVDFRAMAHDVLVVPESRNALLVLKDFQESGRDMAIVLDEFATVRGLLTVNDVVAAALGDIPAFFDEESPQVVQQAEGEWAVDGLLPIEEFQSIFDIEEMPPSHPRYYTIAGFVTHYLKRIPEAGEAFDWNGLHFQVISLDNYRVATILIRKLPDAWKDYEHQHNFHHKRNLSQAS